MAQSGPDLAERSPIVGDGDDAFLSGLRRAIVGCENYLCTSLEILDVEALVASRVWNLVDSFDVLVTQLLTMRETLQYGLTDLDKNYELLHLTGEKWSFLSCTFSVDEIKAEVEAYSEFLDASSIFDLQNVARAAVIDIDFILMKMQKVHGSNFKVEEKCSAEVYSSFFEMHRLDAITDTSSDRMVDVEVAEIAADTPIATEGDSFFRRGASNFAIWTPCASAVVAVVAYSVLHVDRTRTDTKWWRFGVLWWYGGQLACSQIVFYEKLTPHELLERWKISCRLQQTFAASWSEGQTTSE
jgi:hypothetical protein